MIPPQNPPQYGVYPPSAAPPTAPPAAAPAPPPAKPKEEKGEDGGVSWKELAIDKSIDFVLIFVGLYAAIAVQKWQDSAKEKEDYVKLLGDFKHEISLNQKQREDLEKQIGPVAERTPGKALGGFQKSFADFKKEADDAEKLLGCLDDVLDIVSRPPKPKDAARVQECQPIFDEAEKESAKTGKDASTADQFKPITLSPFYRSEVYQLYLADGIKVFENKDLAVKIAEIYTKAKLVEKLVGEIETGYNESFIQRTAEVMASIADLEESMPEGDDPKAFLPLRPKIAGLGREMRTHRFQTVKVENVIEVRVIRLKELLESMDAQFLAVIADIEKELGAKK